MSERSQKFENTLFSTCNMNTQVIIRKWDQQEERLIKLSEEEVRTLWIIKALTIELFFFDT